MRCPYYDDELCAFFHEEPANVRALMGLCYDHLKGASDKTTFQALLWGLTMQIMGFSVEQSAQMLNTAKLMITGDAIAKWTPEQVRASLLKEGGENDEVD